MRVLSIGPQSGTSCKIAILQQVYGPVLNPVSAHGFDLAAKPRADILRRKGSADKFGDLWVTPQRQGRSRVAFVPMAESEAIRGQEVIVRPTHRQSPHSTVRV